MIDFHSHILPGIDDGAKNTGMSLEMLSLASESGVSTIVATPHCFITSENTIEKFLSKRELSYQRLKLAAKEEKATIPEIVLGAEVHISRDISKVPDLDKLCISGTNYILLEMPYEPWQDWMYEEVYHVSLRGLRPILAHLDRFVSQEKKFPNLYSTNALFQINANAFIEKSIRRKILKLFTNDAAHVIGSDMHNTTTRPPNLAEAYAVIERKFGWEYVDFLHNNSVRILSDSKVLPTRLPKLNLFKKLFI